MSILTSEASTATPNPQDQRATEPAALYRLYNTAGTLLYIGVTDNPDRRFRQHRDTKPWWPQVAKKAVEWHPSRARALAEEAAAIQAETPVYNIDHNPAAPSYHWPPAGMPADRVDTIEREASTLPASEAEGIRRAAFEEFTRTQLDERATATAPSTPTDQHTPRIDPAVLTAAVHEAMRETLPHKYTPDLADAIAAQTIANLTGVTSTPCPVFRDCTDTTPGHYDHFTHDAKVLDDADGSTILDAGMVANSGSDRHVIVYLRNAEFTDPAAVRAKTAEVRAFLDQVDELADRVFADQQARTQQAERAEAQA